jgi:hypothetical protein
MVSLHIRFAILVALLSIIARPAAAADTLPENLARRATATATSEHNQHYLAKFAIDGRVPPAGSGATDLDAAWCVLKARSGDHADFTLQWKEPIRAAEIVYFGRTAWYMNECWKDYEVYLDDAKTPAARGTFKMVHGPQRVALPGISVTRITIKFLNSYGGMNPGASEIMVFAASPDRKQLAAIARRAGISSDSTDPRYEASGGEPPVDQPDRQKLRGLIVEMMRLHGSKYPEGPRHLARLDELAAEDASEGDSPIFVERKLGQSPERKLGPSPDSRLAELQREVLLLDVDRLLVIRRHEIQASHVYTYHYEGQRDGGGLYVVSARDPSAKPLELVASPQGEILDCDLSYDAKKVLFSWRHAPGAGYHLWTVNIDGSNLRQLTDGDWHDYNACWLPDGGIAFLSTRNPQFAYCWHAPVGVLHRMDADGRNLRKLSGNYLNDFTPYVLDDGRIIYTRWEYVDRPAIPIQSLWTINPDGTALAGYFGNRKISPATFMEARSIPGTTKILCTMTGHNGPTRGAIGVIDRAKGMNSQESIENITPDTPIPRIDQGCGNTDGSKPYSCPLPLDRHRFLVSARGPILVRTIAGDCQSTVLPAPADGTQYFDAQPVRPRARPPVIASALPEKSEPMATLFLQDVYNGLEPQVRRGEVKTIRVVRELHKPLRIDPGLRAFGFQFPVISCGATYAAKDVLGEVPVEADGSACFRVPSGVPIYFMALDAEGRAVQRMRSFTHLMPGEVQGCIGCHEHRQQASRPQLGTAYTLREPRDLQPPPWGTGGFDYSRVVQPVLDKHCIKCHNSIDPPQQIDLTGGKTDFFNVSYECLARENQGRRGSPYVSWIPTYNGQEWNILEITPKTWGSPVSRLAEVVLSGHPDKDGKRRFEMDEASRRGVLAWIDLNVPYYSTSETSHPGLPGCRQILPQRLEAVLADVGRRRCAECHQGGRVPRRVWVRITEPELNPFLVAPLARTAGGSQRCGKAVFADKSDADYRAILGLFEPIEAMLRRTPRTDMPGSMPSMEVSRCCK